MNMISLSKELEELLNYCLEAFLEGLSFG